MTGLARRRGAVSITGIQLSAQRHSNSLQPCLIFLDPIESFVPFPVGTWNPQKSKALAMDVSKNSMGCWNILYQGRPTSWSFCGIGSITGLRVYTPPNFHRHRPWKMMVGKTIIIVSFWGPAYFEGLLLLKFRGVDGMVGLFLDDPRFPSQSRQGIQDFHKDCSQEWRVKQRFFPAQASAVLHVCCGVAGVDLKHVKEAFFAWWDQQYSGMASLCISHCLHRCQGWTTMWL